MGIPTLRIGLFLGILGFLILELFPQATAAATRVDLVLNEPAPARKVPWPITTGVPFPRGQLASAERCRLLDDKGQECPLQARVAATWDAQRRSVRWLTIDFIAHPGRKYTLEFGPDVRPQPAASPLSVKEGERIRVATGVLTAEFSARGPSALGPIRVDLNGDGEIRPDEIVAEGSGDGEHSSVDQNGRRASSAGDGADRRIVVETSGPVRACVRVDGYYTGPDGQRTVAYRTRYHFFAGLGLVKCVDELRVIGSTRGIRWRDVSFALRLPRSGAGRKVAVDVSGDPGNQVLTVQPDRESRSVSSFQATYRHYGNPECVGGVVETGPRGETVHKRVDRVGEWMQVTDSRASVTGSLRWLWQQFSAEWEATPDSLRLHLWSPRGGDLDFSVDGVKRFLGEAGEKYLLNWRGVRPPRAPTEHYFYFAGRSALEQDGADGKGINKHHELYYHFAPAGLAEQGQEYGRLAAEPPLALASGAWNCSTDVFGPLAPRPNDSPDEAVVDRIFDLGRQAQNTFGDYGWWLFGAGPHYSYQWDADIKRHYADPRRFEYHTYHKETQLWWCYLRSGERKFFNWALPSENHWVDIAVSHTPTTFQTTWRGGEPIPAITRHWPRGDWSIDSSVHYLRHHDTGEAWLRGQSQFWASYHRTLETTTLAYYLTGDERFNDVIGYWRDYWGDLAGKTSISKDFQPWHREQAWYQPAGADEKPKSWAEMIRDYAPFASGSRHQMTLLFNLSALYEHTWDPKIGQALKEYADAFLDPGHPIGVWRSQDNSLPAHAEAPHMAHFWAPALWRYGRASGDSRIPGVLRRYYDACLGADPFDEDVGVYSSAHIGYAYYYTRDPRHLRPALRELERLRPNAAPLARPEELGLRLYNPYAPARALAGIPRLLWALQEAKREGVDVPPAPLTRPQRAPTAFHKQANVPIEVALWGFDKVPHLLGPDVRSYSGFRVQTKTYVSPLQPFDRTLSGFEVYQHRLTIPAEAQAGWYILTPKLETAVLELQGSEGVCCNASVPIALYPGQSWLWQVPPGLSETHVESASPKSLRMVRSDSKEIPGRVGLSEVVLSLGAEDVGKTLRIESSGSTMVWFRLTGPAAEQCWVATAETVLREKVGRHQTTASLPAPVSYRPEVEYTEGRFGKGVSIGPGRSLHLPDHVLKDGKTVRFFDAKQGTVEFWIKRLWDDRLAPAPKVTFLSNGLIEAWSPWKLPLNDWAHVAVVWLPLKKDPKQTLVHIYVNGLDQAYYRSTYWEGYGNRPFSFPQAGKWLEEFVSLAPAGGPFVLDELRVSAVPRYANTMVDFGGQQTFNPVRFTPLTEPFRPDRDTLLLFHFDGSLKGGVGESGTPVEGRFGQGKR